MLAVVEVERLSRSCRGQVRPWGTAARAARKASGTPCVSWRRAAPILCRVTPSTPDLRGIPGSVTGPTTSNDDPTGQESQGQTALGVLMQTAILSLHVLLVQPGAGDGSMNVYVRELVSSLAQAGVTSDVYVRRWAEGATRRRGSRAGVPGPPRYPRGPLTCPRMPFPRSWTCSPRACWRGSPTTSAPPPTSSTPTWLSAVAGHRLKHELDLPLFSTFPTLWPGEGRDR